MQNADFDCQFRPANPTDRASLHELLHACWIEIYSPHAPPIVIEQFKADNLVDRHLDAFLNCTEVAVVNGGVVGSISHCFGAVHGLFVRKEFRGNRIGSSLLFNAALDGARILDVSAFNVTAIHVYERCGWVRSGEFTEDLYGHEIPMLSMKFASVATDS